MRVNDGIWARTSETSTTHVRSLMCFVGMCDSTHFLTVAIASCAVRGWGAEVRWLLAVDKEKRLWVVR